MIAFFPLRFTLKGVNYEKYISFQHLTCVHWYSKKVRIASEIKFTVDSQGNRKAINQLPGEEETATMGSSVLILGIGNVLWADEGFGVRCVERLAQSHAFDSNVRLMDGGTQGLYLLPFLEEADILLVFDAVDYGLEPGTLKIVEDDEVPAFMGAKKMSLHQTGFQDVIATAQLMGTCPEKLILIGCQPEELEDYGGGLRDVVAARIDPAINVALKMLAELGIEAREGSSDTQDLADYSIRQGAYEAGRPSAEEACRVGDERFLPARG